MDRAKFIEALRKLPVPDLRCPGYPPKQRSTKDWEIPILHVSDTQWGKRTRTYNSDVARKRMFDLALHAGKVIDARKSFARIEEARLYLGGDIVEGQDVFKGQAHHIDSTVQAQAIHGASSALARLALRVLSHVRKLHVVVVGGNHGDTVDETVNWDEVCYEVMKRDLLGGADLYPERKKVMQRITFAPIGPWYHVDKVFGWGNLIVHGHQFKGSFIGSGFKNKVSGWIDAIPEPWDYIWFGHYHTLGMGVMNRRIYLANGTTESDNDWAQEHCAATGHPVQRLATFNEKYGLVSDYPLYLNARRANKK